MLFRTILTIYLIFGALAGVALIKKEREPITESTAIVGIIISAIIIYGLWNWL